MAKKQNIVKRLIKKLFRCPQDRTLFLVWREKTANQGMNQKAYMTKVKIGRYTLIRWETIYTPVADWDDKCE